MCASPCVSKQVNNWPPVKAVWNDTKEWPQVSPRVVTRGYKHPSARADIHTQDLVLNSKPDSPPLTPCAITATTTEAWATATEALAAWALAVAVDAAASADWASALALEAMDVALDLEALDMATIAAHLPLEDMDSLASTDIPLQHLKL